MSELLDTRPPLAPARAARSTSVVDGMSSARAGLFVAASIGVHVVLAVVMPREAHTLSVAPARDAEASFFEVLPAPPPPPEPPPVPELAAPPPPPEPVARVRAVPSPEPPAADPAATPEASTVVPDTEVAVQEATVGNSTEGGLAVSIAAGAGNGGAVAGTRHEGPVGTPAVTREQRRADLEALMRAYRSLLFSELRPHLRTPRAIGREAEARTVKLGVTIDASGRVLSVRLRESCGAEHLDALALESLRAVAHVSAPPSELPWSAPREITFPVVYR